MKRRNVITAALALGTGAGTAAILGKKPAGSGNTPKSGGAPGAPALSQNRRQLRLATSWPKDFPGLGGMPVRLSEYIRAATNGRIDIKVYAAGELVGATECFDAVSTGAADMYHAAEYYWQGKSKGFNFFTAVPMGFTASEMTAWMNFGGGQELWDALSAKFNIKGILCGTTGNQMGGWFKREINTLEDLKGLKVRMPGIGGEVIRRLGGAAVNLAGGEIYQALQSGAIDATEWVGPWNDYAFGFYREAPYYYGPGFHEPGAALSLGINLSVWNSFSAIDQAIIKQACTAVNTVSLGEYTYENAKALDLLKSEHGIEPRVFSKEIWDAIGKVSDEVVAEIGNESADIRPIYESYIKARNQYRFYTEISDGAYIAARKSALET